MAARRRLITLRAAQVDQLDRGRAAVAGAVVAGLFDKVGVVAASFDDPRGRSGAGVRG
jgi:hypothetical protein